MLFEPRFIDPLTYQWAGSSDTLRQEQVFAVGDLSTWLSIYLIGYGVWLGRHRRPGQFWVGPARARLRHRMAYGCIYYHLALTGDRELEAFSPVRDAFRLSVRSVPLTLEAQEWLTQLCEAIDRYVGQFFDLVVEDKVRICDGCAEWAAAEGDDMPLGVRLCHKVGRRWLCQECRTEL